MLYTAVMDITDNVSLRNYSTMRLGGNARHLCTITSKDELVEAVTWANQQKMKFIVIGEGSNIVWQDAGFNGLVILNTINGVEKLAEDDISATYKIGAGEAWDTIVERMVAFNLSGIECLSLIPGTAGATPVQNVGAYGQEISQTLLRIEAYDTEIKKFVTVTNQGCAFSYRTSRFKTTDKGRFIITSITLKLLKTTLKPPFYPALEAYLATLEIHAVTPQIIRDAVVAIRTDKMPDWHKIANNGSFFGNPIVPKEQYLKLHDEFPDLVAWEHNGAYKLSAGWLLEKAGFKGYHDPETGMATSAKTALVIINEHATSTADLIKFKQKITSKIQDMFGIALQQEPELIS